MQPADIASMEHAFFDWQNHFGRATTGARIIAGELEALRGSPGGGGATIEGSDGLVAYIEEKYGRELIHTRAKRAKARAEGVVGDREPPTERRELGLEQENG